MTSAVEICSQASVLIGGAPITSFLDGTAEATAANTLYEPVVLELLSAHRWRFASGQVELNRLEAAPVARWDAAYQLPTNPEVLVINAVTVADNALDFDRYEDKVYCNAAEDDVVALDYTFRPDETRWPPYFTTIARLRMAAALASAIPAKADLALFWSREAEKVKANGTVRDSQGRTARKLFRGTRFKSIRRIGSL